MDGAIDSLKQERLDAVPIFNLPNVESWFEQICEDEKIPDPVAAFSQIETWMGDGTLLPDVQPDYKNSNALKTFLRRVTIAGKQAIQDSYDTTEPSLYHRLEGTPLYRKLNRIDSDVARAVLVFASARPKASNRIEERLEVEIGRWGVHNFRRRDVDNYFFRQGCTDFQQRVRRNNGILKNGTDQAPTNHQYEIIERRTLKQIGQLLIALEDFDYGYAKSRFEDRLPNDLTLQNYATCAAQLETFCPTTYKYCQELISQAAQTEGAAENALYFLGTVMRVLYRSIKTARAITYLTSEGKDIALQHRLNDTLVRERLSSSHQPGTTREENQTLWSKIDTLKAQTSSPEAVFNRLNDQEKLMIAQEKLRGLARACRVHPREERLI